MKDAGSAEIDRQFKGPWYVAALIVALVTVCLAIGSNGLMARYFYFDPSSAGDIGARLTPGDGVGFRVVVVHDITPQSPLNAIGIKNGDALRLERPWDDQRMPLAGERITFASPSGNVTSVVLPPSSYASRDHNIVSDMAFWSNLSLILVGLALLWRSRGDGGIVALGLAMTTMAAAAPFKWPIAPGIYPSLYVVTWLGFTCSP